MSDELPERREPPRTGLPALLDHLLAPIFAIFATLVGGILGALTTAFGRAFGIEPPDEEPPAQGGASKDG